MPKTNVAPMLRPGKPPVLEGISVTRPGSQRAIEWEIGVASNDAISQALALECAPATLTARMATLIAFMVWKKRASLAEARERCGFERLALDGFHKRLTYHFGEHSVLRVRGDRKLLSSVELELNQDDFAFSFDSDLLRELIDDLYDRTGSEPPPHQPQVLVTGPRERREPVIRTLKEAGYNPVIAFTPPPTAIAIVSTSSDELQLSYELGAANTRKIPHILVPTAAPSGNGDGGAGLGSPWELITALQRAVLPAAAGPVIVEIIDLVTSALHLEDSPQPTLPLPPDVAAEATVRDATIRQQRYTLIALRRCKGTRRMAAAVVDHADVRYHARIIALRDRLRAAGGSTEDFLRACCTPDIGRQTARAARARATRL